MFVSSKTLAELEDYRVQFDLPHPVVAENGAALDIPVGYFPDSVALPAAAVTRDELQAAYLEAKGAGGIECAAFFELGVPGIIRETGLSELQAERANDRLASEPILWRDSDERLAGFAQTMQLRGYRCIRGGRFVHLMGDASKERAVRELMDAYTQKYPDLALTSISLGDGPNDIGMLSCTDIAVVIAGKHDHNMSFDSTNRVIRPEAPGPVGWNEAILTLLAELPDKHAAAHDHGV